MALTWDLEPTGHGGKDVGPRVNAEPEWWRTALWVYGGFLKIHSFSESADKLFRNIFRIYKKKGLHCINSRCLVIVVVFIPTTQNSVETVFGYTLDYV